MRSTFTALCILQLASPIFLPSINTARAGQQPAPQQTGPDVVRVTARLVQVSVVVQDKNGEPVTDLKPEEFTVLDEGKKQSIAFFSVQDNRVAARPVAPLPLNTFTNRLELRGQVPSSVTAILIDQLNTGFLDQRYMRNQVVQFLKQLQPTDRVALFLLARQLVLLHDFTSDATSLLRALEKVETYQSAEMAATPDPNDLVPIPAGGLEELLVRHFNDNIRAQEQRIADRQVQNRAAGALEAIELIAHRLERLPGRKNLVWVSGAFPFALGLNLREINLYSGQDAKTLAPVIERTARAVTDANVAVYPVDARGLLIAFSKNPRFDRVPGSRAQERGGMASDPLQVGKLGVAGENPNAFTTDETAAHFASMNLLADRTGGRAFYNTNDIRAAIRRAIDDSRVTYTLGYYPTHKEWNGKFRKITVKISRPGIEVRSRAGYLALADRPRDKNLRITELREGGDSPLEDIRLGIVVQAEPVQEAGGTILRLKLQLDPAAIELKEENGTRSGGLDLLFVQRNGEGATVDTFATTQPLSLDAQLYATVKQEGLILQLNLPMRPGAAALRVVIRDTSSGLLGSVDISLRTLAKGK